MLVDLISFNWLKETGRLLLLTMSVRHGNYMWLTSNGCIPDLHLDSSQCHGVGFQSVIVADMVAFVLGLGALGFDASHKPLCSELVQVRDPLCLVGGSWLGCGQCLPHGWSYIMGLGL